MPNPAKESLIFLPGLLCDRAVWRQQMGVLGDIADCACMEWSEENSLPAMAETTLRQAPERFSVAGHSMGGRVALEIYRLAPQRVARIALLNTGYQGLAPDNGKEEANGRYALLDVARQQGMKEMARKWVVPMVHPDRLNDTALVDEVIEMFSRKTPEIFAAQIRALLGRADRSAVLDQIHCPALLLSGREDTWSPPSRHAEMAARIPGSRLEVIPDCGHMSPLERPAEVAEALRGWLALPS